MDRFQGLIGIVLILGIAWLASSDRKRINYRLVGSGIALQTLIALLIFKVGPVQWFFQQIGKGIGKMEQFSKAGVNFVYGGIATIGGNGAQDYRAPDSFVFAFNVTATIVLVCALVAVFYHYGIMQRFVA